MPISVFWRLTLGYLVILLISVAASSYSIIQLERLSSAARTVMNTDNRMIAYQEQLTDTFLSEARYAGRFLITGAGALHDELQQFKTEFARYMSDLQSLAASADLNARLTRIHELHARYHSLFDQEVRYIKNKQPYAESRYQREREKIFETALAEMERLRSHLQKNLHDKLQGIERAARTARTVAIVTTLFLIGLAIVLSVIISSSTTGRLSEFPRIRPTTTPDKLAKGTQQTSNANEGRRETIREVWVGRDNGLWNAIFHSKVCEHGKAKT